MSFFKKLFSKKKKEKQISKPIPRSGTGGKTEVTQDKTGKFVKKSAWIDRLTAPSSIKQGEVLKISVSGNFSDQGYTLDKGYTQIHDNDIIVSVIGMKKPGTMAGQALKPYATTVEVKNLKKGKYTIVCEKGNAKKIQIKVQ